MSSDQVYAGIDIGGTNIKYGLVDGRGKVLLRDQRPTVVDKGAEPLMHLITNISENLLFMAAEEDHDVRWLGVGTPGAVDRKTGTVVGISPNIDGWHGTEIGQRLSDRLNLPVHVDNDVNTMAVAEAKFGAGIGFNSILCVAIGTGVGGGVIINGKLWRGANHTAGEIGHTSINFDGPKCRCGQKGCLEAYCSSSAMIERAKQKLGGNLTPAFEEVLEGDIDDLTIKKLFAAVRKGDEIAQSVIDETASYLATGLANAVNLLNPEVVILGGGIAEGGGGFVEAVTAELRTRAIDCAATDLRVARATLGNDAGFIGAGILGEVEQ